MLDEGNRFFSISQSSLRQNKMPQFKFALSDRSKFILFSFVSLVFVSIGISILYSNYKINEIKINYTTCTFQVCELSLYIDQPIRNPIFLYYFLENFYANHKRFSSSINFRQLRGDLLNPEELRSCSPVIYVKDLKNIHTLSLPDNYIANPCGLKAKHMFNDSYKIYKVENRKNKEITIKESQIIFHEEFNRFRIPNPNTKKTIQWTNITNEHFISWIKVPISNDFRKLWGVILEPLEQGSYKIIIDNKFDSNMYGVEKGILITMTSKLGNKQSFLGFAYISIGILFILCSLLFLGLHKYSNYILNCNNEL